MVLLLYKLRPNDNHHFNFTMPFIITHNSIFSTQPSNIKTQENGKVIHCREGWRSCVNRIPSDLRISIKVKGNCLCCSLPRSCGRIP